MTDLRRPHRPRLEVVRSTEPDVGVEEINAGHLRAFVERIERLNEEKKALGEDIKEVYAEAKGNGFDPKILRKIVTMRGQDPEDRIEQETILELYLAALGAN